MFFALIIVFLQLFDNNIEYDNRPDSVAVAVIPKYMTIVNNIVYNFLLLFASIIIYSFLRLQQQNVIIYNTWSEHILF